MNAAASTMRLVTFRLGDHLFAADIFAVERVLRPGPARALPEMPAWMEGVIDSGGSVVPVIDLRKRFGMPERAGQGQARLLVCAANEYRAAFLVDAVLDVRPLETGALQDPPAMFRGLGGEYLQGLSRRQGELVVVLDMPRLLASSETLTLQGAAESTG
jgi:purine-binding chemotaxis protein CheW